MLEVIDKGQTSERHPVPLLFVHGAWHGAWCWDENFLDFFVARGFRVLAPNLRGHGSSATTKSLRLHSIADYVGDVSSVVDTLPAAPVMVGHSMGGFVVQKYLEARDAPAAVLMASAPPRGQLGSLLRSMRRHPWLSTKFSLTGRPSDMYSSLTGARELFFGEQAPDELVESVANRLQTDSLRAIMFDMVAGNLVDPQKVNTPMLVTGAESDQVYVTADVRRTADAHGVEPVFFSDMGHDMMLDLGWRGVAEFIESWLSSRGL